MVGPPARSRPLDRLQFSDTEKIDRDRMLRFDFAGQRLEGYAGDTVASALWANGIRTFGRSFEYHRPRGLYDLEGEGSSQLVSINGVPNQSAGTTLLRRGMTVGAQNVKGDPRRDVYGVLDSFDRWMPAGFYYRLFFSLLDRMLFWDFVNFVVKKSSTNQAYKM